MLEDQKKLESTHYRCSRPPFRQVSGEDEDLSALGVPLDAVVKVDVGIRSWEVSKGGQTFVFQKYRGLNPLMSHSSAQFLKKFGGSAGVLKK